MRVLLLALLLIAFVPQPVLALDKVVTVTGEAEINAAPDMAVVRLGVTTQAPTAREASDTNAKKMAGLFAAIKSGGIAEADIQTSRLSLYPQTSGGNNPRVTGFQATNQVAVKVRDIAGLSGVLDRAIAAGANDISGIEFIVSDQSRLLDRARAEAVADAKRKAEIYAAAAGATLGRAVSIAESSVPPARPALMFRRGAEAASVPVAPGEQTLRLSITVSYDLQ